MISSNTDKFKLVAIFINKYYVYENIKSNDRQKFNRPDEKLRDKVEGDNKIREKLDAKQDEVNLIFLIF